MGLRTYADSVSVYKLNSRFLNENKKANMNCIEITFIIAE